MRPPSSRRNRTVTTVPVVEEQLVVGKRSRPTGGVRVHKTTSEQEQLVDVPALEEDVRVQRVPVDRPVKEAVGPHYEGDTLVIPVFEEVVRIEKQLVLKEEVRITKRRHTERARRRVRLRREHAEVTTTPPAGRTRAAR